MDLHYIIFALTLGLFSSFHCVGMCGAIAFSLPVTTLPKQKKIAGIFLYNLGRILSYAVFGLVFGILGRKIFVAGIQQWFTIIAGIIMLLIVVLQLLNKELPQLNLFKNPNRFFYTLLGKQLGKQRLSSTLLIGIANGFLPCGLVYLAITGAVATGSVADSIVFMASFGLGTVPAMLGLSLFGFTASLKARNLMRKSTPFIMACMAVLLILRGLNLGIPYVSPYFDNTFTNSIQCH